jgi:hypothetical protein
MVVHLHDKRSPYLQTPNELSNAMISNPAQYRSWVLSPIVKAAQFAEQLTAKENPVLYAKCNFVAIL